MGGDDISCGDGWVIVVFDNIARQKDDPAGQDHGPLRQRLHHNKLSGRIGADQAVLQSGKRICPRFAPAFGGWHD